ncbi:MAG: hypothetical protein KJO54_11665 [Gammaproteobacteria bacterium]|nr:hypothetical protein [Gammaproteobacteria bacterium]NNF62125.1 hypothetical protein [Gammaproteobacteria bacterium]
MPKTIRTFALVLLAALGCENAFTQIPPGEAPALSRDFMQDDIASGAMTLDEIRHAGMQVFATPFNKLDGYGDGPTDPADPTSPGGRPTLQNNGTLLRVNGLDAQSCQECHSVGSSAEVPFRFAVGGAGSSNNNAIFQPREIDVSDSHFYGYAFFDGRFINPPFLFGSGGIELLAKEMTANLQKRRYFARRNPGKPIPLTTHGVNFGSLTYDAATQSFDYRAVSGIDNDLVVKPFGRKGEFATVRAFDVGAMAFHFGMQAVEDVGSGIDADGDGVTDEVLVGQLSALHIFNTNLERPLQQRPGGQAQAGAVLFEDIGCAGCHVPEIRTRTRVLRYTFPEDHTRPNANTFFSVDLSATPAGFGTDGRGLSIPLFSDLKRHDMGDELAESFGGELDRMFITARLWGVADTAPYLHDGRALTLTDAILAHGGEAQPSRDSFAGLDDGQKVQLLEFLRTLRTPVAPAADLLQQ